MGLTGSVHVEGGEVQEGSTVRKYMLIVVYIMFLWELLTCVYIVHYVGLY